VILKVFNVSPFQKDFPAIAQMLPSGGDRSSSFRHKGAVLIVTPFRPLHLAGNAGRLFGTNCIISNFNFSGAYMPLERG